MKKLLALLLLVSSFANAGQITGTISTATSGPIQNGTLTLTPTQAFVVAGTATVVSSPVACYTDGNGNVVGEPNPLVAPTVTTNTAAGTLAAGTYFIRFTYYDASGESVASFETTTLLGSTGTLIVTPPTRQPATATGYKIYISTVSSSETLQSTQVGFPTYQQSSALIAGSALPSSNTSACKPFFNDQGSPVGGYNVTLTNSSGATVSGFPQKWQLMGGAAGTVNLSNGTPLWNGFVQYPQAIVTTPAFNASQSIAGGLNLNGNPLTGVSSATINGALTDCSFDGMFVVGSSCYANIAAAITAAGSIGSILIPRSYAGTDAYTPPGLNVVDLRTSNGNFENRVQSIVAPSFPVTNFPLGSDLVDRSRGPADNYLEHLVAATTTAVTLNVGANTNFLVTTVTVGNGTRSTLQTGTTSLLSTSAGIIIGRETANEEIVAAGSWSIVDGTHITATCTKTHSGTTDIEQLGSLIFNNYLWTVNARFLKPAQNSTYNPPLRIQDSASNGVYLYLPSDTGTTWPFGGFGVGALVTGWNGANKDLVFKHNTSASVIKCLSSTGGTLCTFDNSGNFSLNLAASRLAVGQASATMSGDFRGAAIGAGFDGVNITDGTARVQIGYTSTTIVGTKLVPVQVVWGPAGSGGSAGDLYLASRGNQPTNVFLCTSPDAGTTGLVCSTSVTANGSLKTPSVVSGGAAAGLTGTGACATFSTQTGGSMAGRATCTGTTGASTLTITPGTTAPNGWVCSVQDQTTRANLLQQTATVAASCTLTATSITQNDVFVFTAIAF